MQRLTETKCRTVKSGSKAQKLNDGHGLYLEVRPSGRKTWLFRFKLRGRENLYTVGDYATPPVGETREEAEKRRAGKRFTLAEARRELDALRDMVKQGIDPAQERRLDKLRKEEERATTFELVAREWVGLKDWADNTKARRLDMLERVVFPKIGPLPVREITSAQVLTVLEAAHDNNGPSVAEEAKRSISGVFQRAVATLRADTDPTMPLRGALPRNKTQHRRPLTLKEIGQLMRDLDGYERNMQTVAAFKIMWLTLARPGEVLGARWEEIDLEAGLWRIPPERMKMRQEHLCPLPRQAVEILRSMQGFTGHREHVFPHRDKRTGHMTDAALRQALKNMGWAGKYSPHATRHSGSTRLNELGYAADWIERQLAHDSPNAVRRTYHQAIYLEERRRMMQAWADCLDALRDGGKVIPINRAASGEG